ncbi:hypothetical protein [Pedobacter sp. JCM 36344]|uniref:hypothetical protein n=1 Tax=Pedobacter sp. JCM 36344 TaxID=3374280 RepID=UPI00397E6D12
METKNINNSKEPIKDDTKFENSDIDPGFLGHQEDSEELKGEEDERAHNIDSDISIKEMREGKKDGDNKEIVAGSR